MKQVDSKLLLGLIIGAAVGGAVAYLATSDKKEIWLDELNSLANKAKEGLNDVIETAKNKYAEHTGSCGCGADTEETIPSEV